MKRRYAYLMTAMAVATAMGQTAVQASSHREAPGITKTPKVDSTDFYMFRSYEPGRSAYVTFIANFQPGQGPGDGPNYYTMDPDAVYEIHVDSDGNAQEDLTFQFKFSNTLRGGTGETVSVGGVTQPIALRHIGQITQTDDPEQGEIESYTVTAITGDRRLGSRAAVTNASGGGTTFLKPFDNAGNKTIPNYAAYAQQFIYTVNIPGCATPAKVFVGQRAEAFAVNLGPIFDLVNFVPIDGANVPGGNFPGGITQSRANDELVDRKNVTSIAMEVPIACVTGTGNGVIGAWQTASLPQARLLDPTPTYASTALQGGAYVQVSRLSAPLVNEVVIGLPNKDAFNAGEPMGDAALASYVTNPTFPAILDSLFRAPVNTTLGTNFATLAPTNFPRNDLVATFLTGIKTLNQQKTVTASEMMRLNTGVAPTAQASQQTYGVVADDLAGYPNGRRPGDDVVDITLRVAMGRLCHPVPINGVPMQLGLCTPAQANTGLVAYTDGAPISAAELLNAFPYLKDPIPGAPRSARPIP
ncbi:DUF4331 domain-containing protein [soil metagenome]